MASKKKGVKKTSKKSSDKMMKNSCDCEGKVCKCKIGLMKLSSMAFILFLITVWPAAMQLVHRIHWGWFLGAFVIFVALAFKKCGCRKY